MKTIAVTSAILLSAASIDAAEIFKADNNDNLNLTLSWVGGVVPGAGDIAQWPLVPTGNMASDIGAPWSVAGIVVTNGSDSTGYNSYTVTINGSDTLTLGSQGLDYKGKKNLTINTPISVSADQIWRSQDGMLIVANAVALNGHTITYSGGNVKQIKGAFSGTGSFLCEGGTFRMSNGTAAPQADARITKASKIEFDQAPASGGAYRFHDVTLAGTDDVDGATLAGSGRDNEHGHDKISGTLSVEAGNGTVSLSPHSKKHLSFEASNLNITKSGFLHFRGTNLGLTQRADLVTANSTILFGTAPTLLGGSGEKGSVTQPILPYAVVSTNTGDLGYTFATYDSDYGVRPLDIDTEYATTLPVGQEALENVRLVNDGTSGESVTTLLPNGLTAINSLMIDVAGSNGTGGYAIDAAENASPTLRLNSGMIYVRNMKSQSRTDGDEIPLRNFTLDLNGQRGVFISRQADNNNLQSKALELHCPIVNNGGKGVNFCSVQNRGFIYLYGTSASTYTGPTRLVNGYLKLMKDGVDNVCIPGDLEIYSGSCQNTGNTIPDTADIRIYGGGLNQRGGASNSGTSASETFRDLTMYGGSYNMGPGWGGGGSTTMRKATLFGGSLTLTNNGKQTVTDVLTLAGGTITLDRYADKSKSTLQYLQGGLSITNISSGVYTPIIFNAGSSETVPGAKSTLSVGITFTGNETNDNTAIIDAKEPGEGIAFGQFLMNGDLVFDIGDGAADIDLLIRPQLVDNGTTAGSLAKRGSGTLAIANTNAFTGVTSVDAGRLIADGALAGNVTVAAGATFRGGDRSESGALAVGGNITFAQGAKLEFDPGAATTVAGDVVFGGVEMVLKDGAEITEDVLVMKARSFSGVVSGKFGKFVTRYRNGGTELWLGKDKGIVISIR